MLKKIIVSLLTFLIVFVSVAPFFQVSAAASAAPTAPPETTWYNQSFGAWYSKVYDEKVSPGNEIFGERYTAAQVQWVIYGLMSFLLNASLGSSNQALVSCFLTNTGDVTGCIKILQDMIGTAPAKSTTENILPQKNLLQLVFADRPFSGISYVRHELSKFSLVSTVYAQTTPGFGFDALRPIQDMWRASRNVAFGLFVIVAVVFAFMIMFRVKISPQVVISVQSALPKLIVALILVTFSYAIAGFLIDLMYVVIGLLSLFGTSFMPIPGGAPAIFNFLTLGQPLGGNVQVGVFGLILFYLMIFPYCLIIVLFTMLGFLQSAFVAILGAATFAATAPVTILLGALIFIIALVIVIWHALKIFFMLIKAFVNIILLTIFAPFQIALGPIIPSIGFGTWIKSFISNLAVFVATGFMILLMYYFLAQGVSVGLNSIVQGNKTLVDFFAKLLLGTAIANTISGATASQWPPLLAAGVGTGGGAMIGLLLIAVSFVIFTLIPKVADMIQSFMSGKPFAYGTAVGEAVVTPITTAIKVGVTASNIGKAIQFRKGAEEMPTPPPPPAPSTENP